MGGRTHTPTARSEACCGWKSRHITPDSVVNVYLRARRTMAASSTLDRTPDRRQQMGGGTRPVAELAGGGGGTRGRRGS
jgi:hypothetical protein